MRIKLLTTILLVLASAQSLACDNAVLYYYQGAVLKKVPAKMEDPISEAESKQREKDGKSYYTQLVCDSGHVMSIAKYFQGKQFLHIDYLRQSDGSIIVITTNPDGKVTKYKHEK